MMCQANEQRVNQLEQIKLETGKIVSVQHMIDGIKEGAENERAYFKKTNIHIAEHDRVFKAELKEKIEKLHVWHNPSGTWGEQDYLPREQVLKRVEELG